MFLKSHLKESKRMTRGCNTIVATVLWTILPGVATEYSPLKWTELGFSNFQETIQARDWTCMLLYDPWDERNAYEHTLILEGMHDKMALRGDDRNVSFARLNGRQHAILREEYTAARVGDGGQPTPPEPFAKTYYAELSNRRNGLMIVTNETLLDVSLGTPYWPAKLLVLAPDYNLYGISDVGLILGAIPLKISLLDRWLLQAIEFDREFGEPVLTTQFNLESILHRYGDGRDNTFDFEAYEMAQAAKTKETNGMNGRDDDDDDSTAPRNMRLLLETDSIDINKMTDYGHFVYRKAKVKKVKNSPAYIRILGTIIEEYLAWVDGYETTWSEERKAREDGQTNFGFYLTEMNAQLQSLLDRWFDENQQSPRYPSFVTKKMRHEVDFAQRMQVPNLRGYFQEIIFGSGRNVQGMRKVMEEMMAALGATPQERRRNRYDFNTSTFPMIPSLRELLTFDSMVERDGKLSSVVLADLVTEWHNILRDFHLGLNKHYVNWLKDNPRPNGDGFQFQTMDIIDMHDPENLDLLANYDYFHETYTVPGTPVILSNVELTEDELTLESIIDQCASSLVTSSVQVSRNVGERQAGNGWGGLQSYKLDAELMTKSRRKKQKKKSFLPGVDDFEPAYDPDKAIVDGDNGHRGNNDEEDDKTLTMQQFAILAERLDHLYLHDYGLPDRCDTILYDGTPYSRKQKFKIPSVMASWDLFQRLPQSNYWSSWPSLFVGKKGSNSKLHIDSGATGFFMFLVSGRKRWVVYSRNERVHLYEKITDFATYPDVLGIGKDAESNDFLSHRFPLLHRAEGAYEIIQKPGQLVYIPPSCPHAVENLEDSVGLAMNIVPREGVANHLHEQLHNDMEFASFDLAMNYWLFEDNAQKPFATENLLYTTYGEYKAQY